MVWLRDVSQDVAMFMPIMVEARIRPPATESSPPPSEFDTDSLSSITTSRSKGVNWPMVRRPETRTMNSRAQ